MQLHLHVVVAVARHVEHHARGFVDLDDGARLEAGVPGDRRDQLAGEVVEVVVRPAVALGFPDEPLLVVEQPHLRTVVHPARLPLLAHDHAALRRRRTARDELHDLLPAVRAVHRQLGAVGRPADVVDVVADDVVGERLAVAHVDRRGPLRGQVVQQHFRHRIVRAGFRIGLDVDLPGDLRLVHLDVVVLDLAFVEAVGRDLRAVGRPPDRRASATALRRTPSCRCRS